MQGTTLAAEVVQWFGVAMIAVFLSVLVRAHFSQDSAINLASLIIDGGAVTLAKFGGLLALLTSTWLVVYLAVDKALSEGIFIGYVVGWGGVKVAADWSGRRPGESSYSVKRTTEVKQQFPPKRDSIDVPDDR